MHLATGRGGAGLDPGIMDQRADLRGRTCVVTGGTRGIGKSTALGLARSGVDLVLVCRDGENGRQAREELIRASGNESIEVRVADLSSQAEVRALGAELAARPGRLGVLLHNAAVARPDRRVTVDGLEMQLAVNHLAPFLLTALLRERLVADAPSRVVVVSSRAHANGRIDFADLQGEHAYTGPRAYDQSKLANVLFTYELARRLRGTGVTANCLHPGVVPTRLNGFFRPRDGAPAAPPPTVLQRAVNAARRGWRRLRGRNELNTPEEASRTSIRLASAPDLAEVSGRYFEHGREARSAPCTYDEELAARLWAVSERLTGLATDG